MELAARGGTLEGRPGGRRDDEHSTVRDRHAPRHLMRVRTAWRAPQIGRAAWGARSLAVLVAVVAGLLSAPQPASARGPCGKLGSRCPLIQGVRVLDVSSHSAVLDASFNEETAYEVALERLTCRKHSCKAPRREVVATGTLSWALGHETISLELGHLAEHTGYAVTVTATSATRSERVRRPVRFRTPAQAGPVQNARLTRKIQLHVSHITTTSATLEAVFNVGVEYEVRLTRSCKQPEGGRCPEEAVAAGRSTAGETVRVEVDGLSSDSAYFFRVQFTHEVTKAIKKFHTKPEGRIAGARGLGLVVMAAVAGSRSGVATVQAKCKGKPFGALERACVMDVTADGGKVEAVFREEAEYRLEVGRAWKCRGNEKCPPWSGESVAVGRAPAHTAVIIEANELSPGTEYAFGARTRMPGEEAWQSTGQLLRFRTKRPKPAR